METVIIVLLVIWNLAQHYQIKYLTQDVDDNEEVIRGVRGIVGGVTKELDDVKKMLNDHIRECSEQIQSIQDSEGSNVQVKGIEGLRRFFRNAMQRIRKPYDRGSLQNKVEGILSITKKRFGQCTESYSRLLSTLKNNQERQPMHRDNCIQRNR